MMKLVLASAMVALAITPAAFAAEGPAAGRLEAPTNASGRQSTNTPSNRTIAPAKSGARGMSGNGAISGTSGSSETLKKPGQTSDRK